MKSEVLNIDLSDMLLLLLCNVFEELDCLGVGGGIGAVVVGVANTTDDAVAFVVGDRLTIVVCEVEHVVVLAAKGYLLGKNVVGLDDYTERYVFAARVIGFAELAHHSVDELLKGDVGCRFEHSERPCGR